MKLSLKQIILIVAGVIVAGIMATLVLMRTSHSGQIALQVVVLPDDSTFTIDGKGSKAGRVYVTPGKHTLRASKKGFSDAEIKIDTATIDKDRTLYVMPAPKSEEAFAWLGNHPEVQERRESAAGAEALDIQKDIEKTPLVQQLPFIAPGFEFIVDYTTEEDVNGKTKVIIVIKASTDEAKENARNWIEQQGSKIKDLTITYQANDQYDSFDNPNIGHQ